MIQLYSATLRQLPGLALKRVHPNGNSSFTRLAMNRSEHQAAAAVLGPFHRLQKVQPVGRMRRQEAHRLALVKRQRQARQIAQQINELL